MARICIPDHEYKERVQRCAAILRREKLDALIVNGNEADYANPRYFSGFWPLFERAGVAISAGGDAALTEVLLPEDFKYAGRTLAELDIPHEVVIVFLTRGQELIIPRGNTTLQGGDKVVCVARNTAFHDLAKKWDLQEHQ